MASSYKHLSLNYLLLAISRGREYLPFIIYKDTQTDKHTNRCKQNLIVANIYGDFIYPISNSFFSSYEKLFPEEWLLGPGEDGGRKFT